MIAHPFESSNFNGAQVFSSDINEFRKCLQKLALQDHAFTGPLLTWSNRQGEGFLARKLDRVLINDKWLLSYAHSLMEFLYPGEFDHCPTVIKIFIHPQNHLSSLISGLNIQIL